MNIWVADTRRAKRALALDNDRNVMNAIGKEIAKFACGFEAIHALLHGYLLASKSMLTFFGQALSPALNTGAVIISGTIAIGLGVYAWHRPQKRSTDISRN